MKSIFLISLLSILQQINCADSDDDNLNIYGTWSSKSNTVFTGPGFYDPVDELLVEPALPGISYSFTEDGHFEEAIYQITSNSKNHSCPSAALIYQHGTYEIFDNGSIALTPISIDGRQLLSQPCDDDGISTYSRYSQVESFSSYLVSVDAYHGQYKLNLYEWDDNPVQPLYLAYRPAMILPTGTLNPTAGGGDDVATNTESGDASSSSASASATGNSKRSLRQRIRRSLENRDRTRAVRKSTFDHDFWWWCSAGAVGVGAITYFFL